MEINLFISEISEEIKKIIVYLSDTNHSNIKLLYSTETILDSDSKRILSQLSRTMENVSETHIDSGETCVEWDKNSHNINYVTDDISKAVQVLLSRENNYALGCSVAKRIFFLDAPHKHNLPEKFFHFHYIASLGQLKRILNEYGIEPFSLKDTSLFYHYIDGYYIHKETRDIWYLDRFHNGDASHYEVFDPEGKKHLGEACMKGILDTGKADDKKKPLKL